MRRIYGSELTSLAALLLLAAAVHAAEKGSCRSNNLILGSSRFDDIVLDRAIATSSTRCNGLWKKEGTCCDEDKTVQLAKDDMLKIDEAGLKFSEAVTELRAKLLEFNQNDIKSMIKKSKHDSAGNVLSRPEVQFFKRIIDNQMMISYNNSIKRCWDHMKYSRATALCYICSGKSSKYFFKSTEKAAITITTCSKMLNECSEFFEETMLLIEGARKLGNVTHQALKEKGLSNDEKILEWYKRLEEKITDTAILKYLSKVMNPSPDPKKEMIKMKLCNRFFRLWKTPIVEKMTPIMTFLNDEVGNMLTDFKTSRTLSSLSSLSRKLNTEDPVFSFSNDPSEGFDPEKLLEGDVLVISKSDNLFTSVGTKGAILDQEVPPLNLTMNFL